MCCLVPTPGRGLPWQMTHWRGARLRMVQEDQQRTSTWKWIEDEVWVRSGGIELISLHESRWVGSLWTDIFPRPTINSDEHLFPSVFSEDKGHKANVFKIPPSLLTGNIQMFSFITVLHMLDFLCTVREYEMGKVWNYVKLTVLFLVAYLIVFCNVLLY